MGDGKLLPYEDEIDEELGRGAFGVVYKMNSPSTEPYHSQHKIVAVKKKLKGLIGAIVLEREIETLKKLDHGHIVKYLASGFDKQGSPIIVMEYCNLGSLTNYVKDKPRNDYHHVWRFLAHLSHALGYLHGQHPPIIHSNLNPDNIFPTEDDKGMLCWKIADFGMARVLEKNSYAKYYRTTNKKPIYMAPEVLRFEEYSTSADMWSLGAVLSFLCHERHFFKSIKEVLQWNHGLFTDGPLDFLYGDDKKLMSLADELLSPDPKSRPTAEEVKVECMKDNRQRTDIQLKLKEDTYEKPCQLMIM